MFQRLGLGFFERLVDGTGQPWVALGQLASHAQDVHDREDVGAAVIVLGGFHRVAEQPADVGRASGNIGCARCDVAVDLALGQQAGDGLAFGRVFHAHVVGQLDLDFFRTAGVRHAAAHPGHVGRSDAVVLFQNRAHPDVGRQLVFGQTDLAAAQILGLLNAVGAAIDRGVAEGARQEDGNADIREVALRGLQRGAGQREFADVEFLAAERAKEDFFGRQRHDDRIHAVDLHGAVDQRAAAVVVADGKGEFEFGHGGVCLLCALASGRRREDQESSNSLRIAAVCSPRTGAASVVGPRSPPIFTGRWMEVSVPCSGCSMV
ncbi:hypothetical protein SDC9_88258 [bioreactor metagenome]|uniref:Uncharacterized protein n=1 Tax=bioreactor metagenome TaxID=1076179 RepID=A0A644ZSI3_9ZZZZ